MQRWIAAALALVAALILVLAPGAAYGQAGTATPVATPTFDPYASLSIDSLTVRTYGSATLNALAVERTLGTTAQFTRYSIMFPSDGLTQYGFANIPKGNGPFPVVIAIHGYLNPVGYNTLDYTTRYADAMARAGYIVLHPNLRGYPPSQDGPNLFRVGFAVDVLNLIAIVKAEAGQAGPLEHADATRIGLWGHSMGGGITLRVLTISRDVRAAVLYGAMSGDEKQNFEYVGLWSGGQRGKAERAVPEDVLPRISPMYFLDRITASVSIHHGGSDKTVPLAWSVDLCARLKTLQKPVECFTYPGEDHTFVGSGDQQFIQRTIAFFDRTLKP